MVWSVYSNAQYEHRDFPGAVHADKIYLYHDQSPEIFDPIKNVWSNWTKASTSHGTYGCLVPWRDSLILLGGAFSVRAVESYNVATSTWMTIDSSVPFYIVGSGCVVLPSEEILVVGPASSPNYKSAAIYNVEDNKWTMGQDSSFDRYRTALVVLGKRTFSVGGISDGIKAIEEFDYASKSWKTVNTPLIVPRRAHSMIAIPAELFAHLPGGCEGVM